MFQEDFIKRCGKIHNKKYDYSLVEYKNVNTPIIIICPIHGIFTQKPHVHLYRKEGCQKCGREKLKLSRRMNPTLYINRCRKVHKNEYDYSQTNYINSRTKIKVKCSKHGIFITNPRNHLRGSKCPFCADIESGLIRRYTKDEIIKRFKKIHGGKYDYSYMQYKNITDKIKIKCKKHGFFFQRAYDHSNGRGCPHCNNSLGEKQINDYLKRANIYFVRQKIFNNCINIKTGRNFRFDFFIPKFKIIIEYDGEFHYMITNLNNKKLLNKIKYRDKQKTKWCKENGYNLLRIPYTKFDNINNLIYNFINKTKGTAA